MTLHATENGRSGGTRARNPMCRRQRRLETESGLAEALTAAAGAGGVGVVDAEATTLQRILVVERGAGEQLGTRGVDDHAHAAIRRGQVIVGDVAVEEHLVAEARAAAGAHGYTQGELSIALLG